MIDIPSSLVRNGEGLYEQLLATQPDPTTGQPDPAKMAAFTAAHPEFLSGRATGQEHDRPTSDFANASFNGLNGIPLRQRVGARYTPRCDGRWTASDPFTPQTPEQGKNPRQELPL